MSNPSNVSAEQAYADILPRIQALKELDSEDLENAMKELKDALMKNPSAATLMLPEDIGEMVKALRKTTGQTMVEATKAKKTGEPKAPKAKKTMTADELSAAFDEL